MGSGFFHGIQRRASVSDAGQGNVSGRRISTTRETGGGIPPCRPQGLVPVVYVISQCLGAILAGGVLYAIATGKSDFSLAGGFACNGYGEHSSGQYSAAACFLCEVVMKAMFIVVILGSTDKRAPAGFGPLAIGLCLTLIHLISIPVTNTSVNPARSLGVALFEGGWALEQLWMFIVAPVLGAIVGAIVYRIVGGED